MRRNEEGREGEGERVKSRRERREKRDWRREG